MTTSRRLLIAKLEKELREGSTKTAFGGSPFSKFVSKFSDLAASSGDPFLLKFADKLISYPDFMREANPVEFSSHFVRNVSPKGSAYRDTISPETTARTILEKVVRRLKEEEGKFAQHAADFFLQASNAIRLP